MSLKTSSTSQVDSRSFVAHDFVSEFTMAFNVLLGDQFTVVKFKIF